MAFIPPEPQHDTDDIWRFRLFVSGSRRNSGKIISNLEQILASRLSQTYELTVSDLDEVPELAKQFQILAVPTLLREAPRPQRRVIGDLSDADRVVAALDL